MDEAQFLELVRDSGPIESTEKARTLTEATVQTLGERITDGEAADIAQHLPGEFADTLTDGDAGDVDPFSLETFIDRVSGRAELDEADVIPQSRAVAAAIDEATASELATAREQLPSEFDVIFEPGGPITEAAFLETVQERAGLESIDAAREATTATLQTLGERLSQEEAGDLALYLPDSLARALLESASDSVTAYSVDEFIHRIAERVATDEATARTYAQAVCGTLAETASERELEAAKGQLPGAFDHMFTPPIE